MYYLYYNFLALIIFTDKFYIKYHNDTSSPKHTQGKQNKELVT